MTEIEEKMSRWEIPAEVDDPAWAEKRLAASSIRRLLERFIESEASVETYREIAAKADTLYEALLKEPSIKSREVFLSGQFAERHIEMKDRSVMVGNTNPIAPPIVITDYGEKVSGTLPLDSRFSGAPGLCHGGIIASILDEVLGHACIVRGYQVVTQILTIRYLRPTLLDGETYSEASIREIDGRKITVDGALYVGGTRVASAEGIFVDVRGERFGEIFKRALREIPIEDGNAAEAMNDPAKAQSAS